MHERLVKAEVEIKVLKESVVEIKMGMADLKKSVTRIMVTLGVVITAIQFIMTPEQANGFKASLAGILKVFG